MALNLTETMIRSHASAESFARGEQYERQGAVVSLMQRGNTIQAEVEGSEPLPYRVGLVFDAGGVTTATCTCPYTYGGWCKHIVAALLACMRDPEKIEQHPPLEDLLAPLDRAGLEALVLALTQRDPDLADAVELQISLLTQGSAQNAQAATAATAAGSRPRQTPVDLKAIRRQIRATLREMEDSYDYWEEGGIMAEAARGVLDQAWAFLKAGDVPNAAAILEVITEEYIDALDLYEDGAELFDDVALAWAETLLSLDLTPQERRAWDKKLDAWKKQADDYGAGDALEMAREAVRQGWDYPPLVRVLQGEVTQAGVWDGEPPDYADELAEARLNVLERQGRLQEYLYLAEAESQTARYVTMLVRLDRAQEAVEYGLEYLATTEEALALATALREHGDLEGALRIGEKGLTLEGPKAGLAAWLRDLAATMGRTDLALRAALVAFHEELSLTAYQRVQELAGEHWPRHRAALLERLRGVRSYYPQGPVEIFLHEGLIADAIAAVDEGATHTLVEQVADAAIASHPDWVVTASRRQAEAIMDAGKAQYYDAAARWLARARDAYRAAGREADWRAYRDDLLTQHSRKYKLVPLIKALH